jgi:lipid-binding SYLF domain-containing protein
LRNIQNELRQQLSRANQDTLVNDDSFFVAVPQINFLLQNEIINATLMLSKFKNSLGEEEIPRELLELAKGVVFLTVLKAGFMFTGRYGTGLVIAKLADGTWSAPSAITMTGVGWGFQLGAELTDVMLILASESAVQAFKSRAQIAVGAELGVSVGPLGRSIGSDVSAGNKGAAHAFSYAISKGLFFGASLEATGFAARKDVNQVFYGEDVSVSSLLAGEYPRPKGCEPLYHALGEVMGTGPVRMTSSNSIDNDFSRTAAPAPIPAYSSSKNEQDASRVTYRSATSPGSRRMDENNSQDFNLDYIRGADGGL